jgi:hypothetical protein
MTKTVLFACLLILALQTFAQERGQALKFDEFSYYPEQKGSPLIVRGNRFARQILNERSIPPRNGKRMG